MQQGQGGEKRKREQNWFLCNTCFKGFSTSAAHREHVKIHSNVQTQGGALSYPALKKAHAQAQAAVDGHKVQSEEFSARVASKGVSQITLLITTEVSASKRELRVLLQLIISRSFITNILIGVPGTGGYQRDLSLWTEM